MLRKTVALIIIFCVYSNFCYSNQKLKTDFMDSIDKAYEESKGNGLTSFLMSLFETSTKLRLDAEYTGVKKAFEKYQLYQKKIDTELQSVAKKELDSKLIDFRMSVVSYQNSKQELINILIYVSIGLGILLIFLILFKRRKKSVKAP